MKVLVLGNYRQTITVVRSLARAGHKVVLGTSTRAPFTRFSNCVDEVWQHSEESNLVSFHQELETYLRNESRSNPIVVFPVGELQLRALTNLTVQAQSLAAWVMPPKEVVRGCLDKNRANQMAEKVGVPIPPTRIVTTKSQLLEVSRELGLPLIFKLRDSSRLLAGKKAVICVRPDDVTALLKAPELAEGLQILAQKKIPGYRMNCHFASYDGKVVAYFQQKVLRTTEPDGTGYGVDSVSVPPQPELRKMAEAIVQGFHFTGVGCVQFIVEEPTGKAWFLELNPRLDASTALAYQCGVDFPKLAIELATGNVAPESLQSYSTDLRVSWLHGDLLALLHSVRVRDVGVFAGLAWFKDLLVSQLKARRHLTWDWSDPVPTIYLYLISTPASVLRSLLRGRAARSSHHETQAFQVSWPDSHDKRDPR